MKPRQRSTSELTYLEANGLRFALYDDGEGPLVLLLHGFPDTAETWADLRPRLVEQGYRVVTPFMRGYAPTERPDEAPTVRTLSKDVIALIDALGEEAAIVVGHDWGAIATYGAAALASERIEKICSVAICHPAAIKPSLKLLFNFPHFLTLNLPGAVRRVQKKNFAYLEKLYRQWSPAWDLDDSELDAVRQSFRQPGTTEAAISYYKVMRRLPEKFFLQPVDVPTLGIAGDTDPGITTSHFEKARRFIAADYEVATLQGGHFVHRESPEEFARTLLDWLGPPKR